MVNRVNKTLSLSIEVARRLEDEQNQSATVEAALLEYWDIDVDADSESGELMTDGGRDALAPTDARLLAALVGDSTRLNEVIRVVEDHVGHEIDHDRVYRRAEALGDRGFIALERETGIYRVTPRGAAALAEELHFLADQTGQRVVDPDAEADKLPPRKTTLQGSRPADMPFGTPSGEEADR